MTNLDAIVRELQQQRDRLDAAIRAKFLAGWVGILPKHSRDACQPQPAGGLLPHKERGGEGRRAARIELLRAQDPSVTSRQQVWRESERQHGHDGRGSGQGRSKWAVFLGARLLIPSPRTRLFHPRIPLSKYSSSLLRLHRFSAELLF
jgi:hypothetical protein